ncbi:MAG TPA: nucleotide sugar dehydrogenase [Actinomycetota bacterium]|nr:nucleotide sugar dehydrogenase [Actinomycetota bacterium]
MADPKVAVVGLGKIGLPVAVRCALSGLQVVGCDINEQRVAALNAGRNPIEDEIGLDDALAEVVAEGRFKATTETAIAVKEADVVIVLVRLEHVGTGLDYSIMDAANASIAEGLHPGALIVYETTLPVGDTRRFAQELAGRSGLALGTDLFVAFSPERVYSGRILQDLEAYPKVVGGVDAASGARARVFYERALPGVRVVELESSEAAELVKLAETTYRDINIAFANELAREADRLGIDVDPVIELANSQPFSHIHRPGAGVGGHCIPHYPRFLLEGGAQAPLVKLARDLNEEQPLYVVERLRQELGTLRGKRVLVMGVAYRENVRETTSSPGLVIARALREAGADVSLNDPYYSDDELQAFGGAPARLEDIGSFDAVIVQAMHDRYRAADWTSRLGAGEVVIDGRNALDPDSVVATGATYIGIGRRRRGPA